MGNLLTTSWSASLFQAFIRYEELHCPVLSSGECNFLYKHHFQEYNKIFDTVTINIAEKKALGHYFHAIQTEIRR